MKSNTIPFTRLYYLDWLRVLAMLGVFLYHNAMLFNELSDWHINNISKNIVATAYNAFTVQWGMPLFFILAGAGTYYALRVIRAREYALERTLRLVVPLIFGWLVIIAPQAYYQATFNGMNLSGNFFELYMQYLKTLPDLEWFHLWFLEQLFIFSIITLPLFVLLGNNGTGTISRIATVFEKPWVLVTILVLALTLIDSLLYPSGFWGHRESGGWNIASNALFYISGYLIFSNERVLNTIRKYGWMASITGIVGMVCLVVFYIDVFTNLTDYYGTTEFILSQFIQAISTWSWLFVMVSLASRYLTGTNRFLKYANTAVLPFYILHQTVIIVISFYVVQWDSGVGLKYLTISTTSFVVIMILYEFLIRRVNILRFLFGMRLTRKTTQS
ncbi:MAG: acyltransferase family protein [Dehalococcoidales bacterium]|nr:MAG: acyltransferase family protein [Dehalococcoidales bacterium]